MLHRYVSVSTFLRLIAAVLLFVALSKQPYDYFLILRLAVCFVSAYMVYVSIASRNYAWIVVFLFVGILFNPFFEFPLRRDRWQYIDAGVALLIIASIFLVGERIEPARQTHSENDPVDSSLLDGSFSRKRLWIAGGGLVIFLLIIVAGLVFSKTAIIDNNNTLQSGNNRPNIEMLEIPSGSFLMGSDVNEYERPAHRVTITKRFFIGKFEVTQEQWRSVMGDNRRFAQECDKCPAIQITWSETQDFISKLNKIDDRYLYRLPTEAEWEYACRASTTGEVYGQLDEIAWYRSNSGMMAHSVGEKRPNAFGIHDMVGNVWEWVNDSFGNYEPSPAVDPTGRLTSGSKVLRGGSYFEEFPQFPTSTLRKGWDPTKGMNNIGFRLAASAK